MPLVTVVGLGPGDRDLLTQSALAAITAAPPGTRFVRTQRHPSAMAVDGAISFDQLYDRAASLDDVYTGIVDALVGAAERHGGVLYAVPGSPAVGERSVELLRGDRRVDTVVIPALSCLDLAWIRLGVDPLAEGVRVIDGHRFVSEAAGERGPLLVLQCDRRDVLSAIKLAADDTPGAEPGPVWVLQRLGLPDERIIELSWDDLDREVEPDHLTSLWLPEWAPATGREMAAFGELVRTLRQRCPWDRAQTHETLTRHLIEETYEVVEAIEGLGAGGGYPHLEDELGDLLYQVFFHATLAAEAGMFTMADVARGVHDKLIRRHPHVFGQAAASGPPAAASGPPAAASAAPAPAPSAATWEELKQAEKRRSSVMDDIVANLPALLYAHKVQGRAASVGFDWSDVTGALPKIAEELAELQSEITNGVGSPRAGEELGDLLFACVNVARHLEVDPETALRGATAKFRSRFRAVEALATARGIELRAASLATLDALWDEVKASS